jgi:hypothetical protein
MEFTSQAALPQPPLSPAHLLDAPLPQLLAELDAELYDSSITDADFFGAAILRGGGRFALAMPRGRDEFERDTVARMLLGMVLHVEMAPLPEWMHVEVIPATVADQAKEA